MTTVSNKSICILKTTCYMERGRSLCLQMLNNISSASPYKMFFSWLYTKDSNKITFPILRWKKDECEAVSIHSNEFPLLEISCIKGTFCTSAVKKITVWKVKVWLGLRCCSLHALNLLSLKVNQSKMFILG